MRKLMAMSSVLDDPTMATHRRTRHPVLAFLPPPPCEAWGRVGSGPRSRRAAAHVASPRPLPTLPHADARGRGERAMNASTRCPIVASRNGTPGLGFARIDRLQAAAVVRAGLQPV